jgi:hypothetical protein
VAKILRAFFARRVVRSRPQLRPGLTKIVRAPGAIMVFPIIGSSGCPSPPQDAAPGQLIACRQSEMSHENGGMNLGAQDLLHANKSAPATNSLKRRNRP